MGVSIVIIEALKTTTKPAPKPPTPKRTLKPTPKPSTKPPTTKHPTPSTGNAYPTHPPTPPTRGNNAYGIWGFPYTQVYGNNIYRPPTPSTGNAYGRWGSPYTPAPWYGYNKWLYGNSWSQPQSPPKQTPWYGYNKWSYGNSWSYPQFPPKKTPTTKPPTTKPPTTKPRRTGNAYGIWRSPYPQNLWYGYNRSPKATASPFYMNSFFSHYPVYQPSWGSLTYRHGSY